jgi:L-ascorbate metabolism protein UlaG (beta-lactamase superfamily)
MAQLYYQGHGSYRIASKDGHVLYLDPFAGDGYDVPADLILVTHQHQDHNHVDKPARKPGCKVISNVEALAGGAYQSFDEGWVCIEATKAANKNHDPRECVGYLITIDGVLIYAAGDTSKIPEMQELAQRNIDYAILPADGIYNMGLEEAAECATIIGAKHNIPVHLAPGRLYSKRRAAKWTAPNKLLVEPGQTIDL